MPDEEPVPPAFSVDRLDLESRAINPGRKSGWAPLNKIDVSFGPGELALVSARTGHGKTSFLIGLLANWMGLMEEVGEPGAAKEVREPGDPAGMLLLYSLEESEVQIYHRLLSLITGRHKDAGQRLSVPEVRKQLQGEGKMSVGLQEARTLLRACEGKMQLVHCPFWTVDQIAKHAREAGERGRVGSILVDYLQRVRTAKQSERRDMEISLIGRRLRALAQELGAPVVAGAQINREPVSNKPSGNAAVNLRDRRPQLHQLREGGGEQEADLVLGLLNHRMETQEEDRGDEGDEGAAGPKSQADQGAPVTMLEVGTLKNRYGQAGRWAKLGFVGRYGLIREMTGKERADSRQAERAAPAPAQGRSQKAGPGSGAKR